ncbi:hypothetical protein EDD16DRAFT_1247287 [Pisolithus croceorrhizus]|nr:hypothetical protein EDD16DRAFT_1247287 [Pisolithus croceorrhizus]
MFGSFISAVPPQRPTDGDQTAHFCHFAGFAVLLYFRYVWRIKPRRCHSATLVHMAAEIVRLPIGVSYYPVPSVAWLFGSLYRMFRSRRLMVCLYCGWPFVA